MESLSSRPVRTRIGTEGPFPERAVPARTGCGTPRTHAGAGDRPADPSTRDPRHVRPNHRQRRAAGASAQLARLVPLHACLLGTACTTSAPHIAPSAAAASARSHPQPVVRTTTEDPGAFTFVPGEVEVVLAGLATNESGFDSGSAAVAASFGLCVTELVVFSVRGSTFFVDDGTDRSVLTGRVAADFIAPWRRVRPFAGLSAGFAGGEAINETPFVGVHAGFKVHVQSKAFLQVMGGYDQFFTSTDDVTEHHRCGQWTYSLGTGWIF